MSSKGKPHVVVLGAGPAGLGAAYQLTRRGLAKVTVLEQNTRLGGNAGSFDLEGISVDFGSHRLHPACDPEVLADIRALLGNDLLDRPRHGRIRLQGRWIHFPLKPLDLLYRLPPAFAVGVLRDRILKLTQPANDPSRPQSFATELEAGLGRTICRDFYFPYARKLWALDPEELSVTQARRRVSASSLAKMARRILFGFRPSGKSRFFYPRHGYGQISEAFHKAAVAAGAEFHLGARVASVNKDNHTIQSVQYEQDGTTVTVPADFIWSTIPLTSLVRCLQPAAPSTVLEATEQIQFRAMILIYLVLEQERFSEYDAHYFPESGISISRLSEPKNYSNTQLPANVTVLCAELPCSADGPQWNKSDEELSQLVRDSLATAGIPVQAPVRHVLTRKLKYAYPIYRQGYETHFNQIDQWLRQINGLITFGRQGLFVHDNTHHALYMAYCAVRCLDDSGNFDLARWQSFRKIFDTHVVED